mgnify:CR=1 FL=1
MQISTIDISLIILIEVCKMSCTGKKKRATVEFFERSSLNFVQVLRPSIQVAKIDQFIFSSLLSPFTVNTIG